MCIAILTTAHPDYPFILLNNRDEYLHRPTAPATWWPAPDSHVLGGYDLHRPAHGTWLGITRQGRIAVLTNYREDNQAIVQGARSRGLIPNAWLKSTSQTPEAFARQMLDHGVHGVGGFSLAYGLVQDVMRGAGLAVLSNRTPSAEGVPRLLCHSGETTALSNAAFGDRSWPKVVDGERGTAAAIEASVAANESRDQLVERLLDVLSVDTMPRRKDEEWDVYLTQLRHSIFIPALGREHLERHGMPAHEGGHGGEGTAPDATSGCYGTEKQTVVLVDREGGVFYLERTLFDSEARAVVRGEGDRVFEFRIEGW